MTGKRRLLLSILLVLAPWLYPADLTTGFTGLFSLGMGSGKGLWEPTDPSESGSLYPGTGGGMAYTAKLPLSRRSLLNMSFQYIFARAGQRVEDQKILYTQQSLELPILLMAPPLSERSRLTLGAGPSLTLLPVTTRREITLDSRVVSDEYVRAEKTILFSLQAGADYTVPLTERKDLVLTLRFTHPFTSPGYAWDQGGSGNIRINRIDMGLGVLSHPPRGNKP